MAKMNANKSNDKVTYKDPRDAHYGTKPEMVVKETELPISMLFITLTNHQPINFS